MVVDLYPYLVAVTGISAMMAGWVLVQLAWRRAFPGRHHGGDVLAGRSDCGGCAHGSACEQRAEECELSSTTSHR